jgi:hypothetical protein
MSFYPINFSEPLKTGFQVAAGGSDGPGASTAHTSLRIYGQGALEWGEAVDEDLVRLSENFASASPPPYPIHGQFWYEISLYYLDTSQGNSLQGWWLFDPNAQTWSLLNTTGVVPAAATPTNIYYYDTTSSTLYGFFSLVTGMPQSYVPRSYMTGTGAPINPQTLATLVYPQQTLWVWDAFANSGSGAWINPSTIAVSTTTPPNPQRSSLWYNPTADELLMYNGSMWEAVLLGGTNGVKVPGNIDMQSTYRVINLPAPVNSGDAVPKSYIDSLVGSSLTGYLPLSGGTVTGPTTFQAAVTFTSTVSLSNQVLTNVGTGVASSDGVNLGQVQAEISSAISGASTSNIPQINTGGSYKAGDLAIVGGVVYIAVASGTGSPPGGNWKQIYPAVYAA